MRSLNMFTYKNIIVLLGVIVLSLPVQANNQWSGSIGAADGDGSTATFSSPKGVAMLAKDRVIVADSGNHKIRLLTWTGSTSAGYSADVKTLAGSVSGYLDGTGMKARFHLPTGVAVHPTKAWAAVAGLFSLVDALCSLILVCTVWLAANWTCAVSDHSNHKIRRLFITTGQVETLVGGLGVNSLGYRDGPAMDTALLKGPSGVAFSPTGGVLFIADSSNNRIRMLDLTSMTVSTLAGARVKSNMCAYGLWQPQGTCPGGSCRCGDKSALGPLSECAKVDWDIASGNPSILCQYGSSTPSCSVGQLSSDCKCIGQTLEMGVTWIASALSQAFAWGGPAMPMARQQWQDSTIRPA